ncbi:hypothetical protein BDP27DRAFT_1416636 [Rhodocollybia butyracea]|uniref:Uncharacterized protein n=1 Tax=Rhodocollybia butyracea TaxID=206335 RepID=A0A9P5UCA8_9AGAR|nr:hypothetical protein BDP27DRAFT_1416636 [Rhodocollybia butyracea]
MSNVFKGEKPVTEKKYLINSSLGSVVNVLDLPELEPGKYLHGDTQALEFDVERMRCGEIIGEIRSGTPPCPSKLADLDHLAFEFQAVLDCYEVDHIPINSMVKRANRIRLYREGILSIKAHIRRLSEDVLGEIFKLICCDHVESNRIGYPRMQTLMVSQGQLGYPMVHLFIKRSGFHPLNFKLSGRATPINDIFGFFSSETTNRWRSAIFDKGTDAIFLSMFKGDNSQSCAVSKYPSPTFSHPTMNIRSPVLDCARWYLMWSG